MLRYAQRWHAQFNASRILLPISCECSKFPSNDLPGLCSMLRIMFRLSSRRDLSAARLFEAAAYERREPAQNKQAMYVQLKCRSEQQ